MRNRRTLPQRRKSLGFTLVEAGLVAALFSVAALAVMSSFQDKSRAQERQALRNNIIQFFAVAEQTKQSWGDYDGFSNSTVWQSDKLLPSAMKSSSEGKFITPYSDDGLTFSASDSAIDITGDSYSKNNGFVSVVIADVPSRDCNDTVEDYIGQVMQVDVGSTRIGDLAARDSACSSVNNTTDITLTNR